MYLGVSELGDRAAQAGSAPAAYSVRSRRPSACATYSLRIGGIDGSEGRLVELGAGRRGPDRRQRRGQDEPPQPRVRLLPGHQRARQVASQDVTRLSPAQVIAAGVSRSFQAVGHVSEPRSSTSSGSGSSRDGAVGSSAAWHVAPGAARSERARRGEAYALIAAPGWRNTPTSPARVLLRDPEDGRHPPHLRRRAQRRAARRTDLRPLRRQSGGIRIRDLVAQFLDRDGCRCARRRPRHRLRQPALPRDRGPVGGSGDRRRLAHRGAQLSRR